MPSFDIVSQVDKHELANAMDQAMREISTRFDFRGTKAKIELNDTLIMLTADNDFQIQQVRDIVYNKMTKRQIDIGSFEEGKIEPSGMTAQQKLSVRQGIDKDTAKKIIKLTKDSKLKIQAAIQDEQVRVTGKKRDDLQKIMATLKDQDLGLPLQYKNFRD